jgi:rubrerythrin
MSVIDPAAMPPNVAAFFRTVYLLEREASERYAELADQMEVHNNREVASLFRKLAEIESRHALQILAHAQARQVNVPAGGPASWLSTDGPETTPYAEAHYLMTPQHALFLALRNEEEAVAYFQRVAAAASDPEVRALAVEFEAEERAHVTLVRGLIAKYPPVEATCDDPDPPVYSE